MLDWQFLFLFYFYFVLFKWLLQYAPQSTTEEKSDISRCDLQVKLNHPLAKAYVTHRTAESHVQAPELRVHDRNSTLLSGLASPCAQ